MYVLLPAESEFYSSQEEYLFFDVFIYALFFCQTLYISYIIYMQCNADTVLIDWEKPRGHYSDVSMWRTVMIANEWNKIQSSRKLAIEFHLILLCFLEVGLNLYHVSSAQPNFSRDQTSLVNPIISFANSVFLWIFVISVQWGWRFIIYERYYKDSASQRFIDLATLSKISLFIMDEEYHGYYLHCQSPFEFSDCSFEELENQMGRETTGHLMNRGLSAPGSPPDCQTFEFFASDQFRNHFKKVSEDFTRTHVPKI